MSLKLHNTKSRTLETFEPPADGIVRLYVCGPTVYDRSHLGHARSYVFYDSMKRALRHFGWPVKHVQNFTDVEESIAKRAAESGEEIVDFASRFIGYFLEDMDRLFVIRADAYPRVSEHIDDILAINKDLAKSNAAYMVDCGDRGCDLYFDTSRAPAFGSLVGQRLEDIVADRPEQGDRRSPADFALWKSTDDWGTTWPSKWGNGRPGWHVECTAMAIKHLGPTIDIHGGGLDLIFPHHDSEQAIGETWTGKPYSRFFVHNGFVALEDTKMSKSLGNVVRVETLLKDHDAEAVRAHVLSVHYRDTLHYGEGALKEWEARVDKWRADVAQLKRVPTDATSTGLPFGTPIAVARATFDAAVANDLSFEDATPIGEAFLHDAAERARAGTLTGEEAKAARAAVATFGRVLGLPSWEFA